MTVHNDTAGQVSACSCAASHSQQAFVLSIFPKHSAISTRVSTKVLECLAFQTNKTLTQLWQRHTVVCSYTNNCFNTCVSSKYRMKLLPIIFTRADSEEMSALPLLTSKLQSTASTCVNNLRQQKGRREPNGLLRQDTRGLMLQEAIPSHLPANRALTFTSAGLAILLSILQH